MKNNHSSELKFVEQTRFISDLIKHVSQPMIVTSADRRLLYWNAAFSKLTGYSNKELSDPIISAGMTAPEWHDNETKALEKLQRTGKSQTFQKEYIRKDGSRVPVEVLIYRLGEDNGKPSHYIALITDITERKQLEEELQKSESHYRTLVDNAIEGIVVIQDGQIKFVNPMVTIATGYSHEELETMSLNDLLCPDNEKDAVKSVNRTATPCMPFVVPVLKVRTKGGDIRLIESTIVSIVWDDKPANLNLLRDITERYQSQDVLQQSELKYRSILEDISEGYWEVDLAGNFVSYNDAICRILGYAQKDMANMNYRAYTSPEDVDKVYKAFNKVYRNGKPIRNMQYEIVQKDGSNRFAETSVFTRLDNKGEIIGFRGVSHDITERKQMEDSLRHSEERYRALFDRTPNLVYLHDLEGNFLEANDKALELLGYDRKDIPNLTFASLLSAEQLSTASAALQELKETGIQRQPSEYHLRCKDGSYVDIETVASAIYRGGKIYAIQVIARDLTEHKRFQEHLNKERQDLALILDHSPVLVFYKDKDGKFIRVNRAFAEALQISEEEFLGKTVFDLYTKEIAQAMTKDDQEVLESRQPKLNILEKYESAIGIRWVYTDKVPILDEAGNAVGLAGFAQDITERLQTEEALRQSEEKYRTILEDMEEAYSEVDLAGNFTFFNNALCIHLGYSREELMGMNYKVYTAPEIVKNVFQAYNQVYKTGKSIELFAIEEIKKDGTKMVAEISVAPIKNDTGEIVGFRQLSRDMTERIHIQEALRQSEAKYRTMMEDIEEAYYELDLEGNFTFVNGATGRQLGYSREELVGVNYRTYTAPEDIERVFKVYNGVYRTGKPVTSLLHKEIRKDGRQIIADTSILPLRNENGDIIGFRGVGRDVTQRLQMEEALRQSEEKYRSILETMEETYYEVDLAGNFTFFNETLRKGFGYTKEELMGMSYKVYTPPEIADKVFQAYNQVYRTGEPIIGFPMEQIRKDGTRLVIENSIMPIRNEMGEITGFRGIGRDVTERLRMEEALRQSEGKYRTILQDMEESYYEEDLVGNFTFVNNTLCRDLGYSKEELIGMNYRDYVPPEELERIRQVYNQVYRTGKPIELFSTQQIRKDGNRIYSEISVAPLRDHKDEIIGFRGVGRNITARVHMEDSLRKSEARYRTILEDMQESYFEVDLRGNYTLFNDAQCRQLGYTREEMIGLDYKKITPYDRQKEMFDIYNRTYRTGEPNELFQAEQIRKDGKRIPVEYSVYPIRNEQGEIIGFRGVGRDITKRVQMEEALRQSEERYRTVLEDMEEAYYEEDLAGNFTLFNDALCRQLGYSREELMGMNYKTYTAPEDIDRVFKAFNTVYRTGEPLTGFQMVRITKDGRRVFTETSGFPLRDETGQIIGFRGVIRDVTQRKKAEEERRELEQKAQLASRLASVGELASGVAHEINNPLTGVIGYAHLLLTRKDISRDVKHDLEIINEGAQRVAGIVKKLLSFARQTKPEQRYININELIRNTLELRAYELAANNIKVTLQLTRDMPMTIADPGQLQQVFLNLIINAETEMKAAHDKGRLLIKTERMNSTLRISFKDNGPGIAKDNLETIFDPFFTTREVGQGTGLGLSVCHGIVTEHRGRIWAESIPGKGATFIVELPLITEEEQPESLESHEPEMERPKKTDKARILVVDDEPVIRELVSKVLGEQGHTVETVDNAAAALKMVKSKRYRLILLDIKMPGMSGIELYKKFQKIAPSLTKRVVFVTGDVMGKRTISFLNKTKTPYMMKPFDAKELKVEINRILSKK